MSRDCLALTDWDLKSLEARKAKAVKKAPVRAKAPVRPKPMKKAPVKKVAPKKVAPKKVAPKKVAPAEKVAPKKAVAKKVTPKKAVAAKKVAPKKAAVPAKKVAPKKKAVPAKKVSRKKTAVPAKKVAAKKAATKVTPKKTAGPAKAKVAPKKTAAKSKAPAKAPVKAKVPTKSAAKPAASAKPSALPKCTAAQIEGRSIEDGLIEARAAVSHPSGKSSVTLFHGTSAASAAGISASGVLLTKGSPTGEFNHQPEVPGGFYMGDSLVAAAEFACLEIPASKPTSVDLLEFKWSGARVTVKEFPSQNTEFKNFVSFHTNADKSFASLAADIFKTNDMITGPLKGTGTSAAIPKDFQQYAVVDQAVADKKLKLQKRHKAILCANVPKGHKLSARVYAQGQRTNAKFAGRLQTLQAAPVCVIL